MYLAIEVQDNFLLLLFVNLGLCVFGLLFYALWSVRQHMHDFDWDIFWKHNKIFWIWASIAQFLYAILMTIIPSLDIFLSKKLIAILEAAVGVELNIPEDLMQVIVYLTLAWQLSRLTNVSVNKEEKIGTKK